MTTETAPTSRTLSSHSRGLPGLQSIHHVALITADYARSKGFYIGVLGLQVIGEHFRPERDSWKLDLRLPDGGQLELFSFPTPPPRPSRPEACGLRHLAFRVKDLDQAIAHLRRHQLAVEEVRIDPYTGARFTFCADPDGTPIELYEPAPQSVVADGLDHEELTIVVADPAEPGVQTLFADLDASLRGLYPGAPVHGIDVEDWRQRGGVLLVAWQQRRAVACVGYLPLAQGRAEIKRLYVVPQLRGQGLAQRLLKLLLQHAASTGVHTLLAETGDQQLQAMVLFRRCGFSAIAPFGPYQHQPYSRCFARRL